MPRLDPKERWERKANYASRVQQQAAIVRTLEPDPAPVPQAQAPVLVATPKPPKKVSGPLKVTLMIQGNPLELDFMWKQFEGTIPPNKWNPRDMREMFLRALRTIGNVE